jgi:hypothetical protein
MQSFSICKAGRKLFFFKNADPEMGGKLEVFFIRDKCVELRRRGALDGTNDSDFLTE